MPKSKNTFKLSICIPNQNRSKYLNNCLNSILLAKILFDDNDKLYEHLNKIWNDPLKWWYSENVKKNVNKFVKLYTKYPDDDFSINFKNLIKKNI